MAKKVKKMTPTTVYSDSCGCAVVMTETGMNLDRCALHDAGPELAHALAGILDSTEHQLDDQLEAAERYMDELLDAHGGRITASREDLDGLDDYSTILKLRQAN